MVALLEGKSLRGAAEAAGVSLSTATRRVRSQRFKDRLEKLRENYIDAVLNRLAAAAGDAASKLVVLMASGDARIELGAAKAILDRAIDPFQRELAADLKELRAQLTELKKQRGFR